MKPKRRKKSLVGWTYKKFILRFDDTAYGKAVVHSEIMAGADKIRIDKPVKVKITIEEL